MNMAATLFGMTVEECLAGVTREAARALGLLAETGTLEAGKWADLAIWDIESPAELVYRMGFNPLHARVWRGRMTELVLHSRASASRWPTGSADLSDGAAPVLDPACRRHGDRQAPAVIAEIVAGGEPVYGINTGFGKLASVEHRRRRCRNPAAQPRSCRIAAASASRLPDASCG